MLNGMVGLYLPAPNGSTVTVFVLDTPTKWPEYDIPPSLDSYHTSMFVHHELVCCSGVLHEPWVDRGTEFRGELVRYCKCLGIERGPIAMLNPHANGIWSIW